MYSTCLFCHGSLGRNEVIEPFAVGRRLAFDAHKGRLWAVCRRCGRWNLSPLEERWEAVEECERRFRGTYLRVSTDNIGLARLAEGLELVRVGAALRPELAIWRYGARFRWRRRVATAKKITANILQHGGTQVFTSAITSGAVVSVFGSTSMAVAALFGAPMATLFVVSLAMNRRVIARVVDTEGALVMIRACDGHRASLLPDAAGADGWLLEVGHRDGVATLGGSVARRAAGVVLARINATGGSDTDIQMATRRLERLGDPAACFQQALEMSRKALRRGLDDRWRDAFGEEVLRDEIAEEATSAPLGSLLRLPQSMRLALEMAASEEDERRAMEGELEELEEAWREAEEIAAIADNMFLPRAVEEWLERHRLARS